MFCSKFLFSIYYLCIFFFLFCDYANDDLSYFNYAGDGIPSKYTINTNMLSTGYHINNVAHAAGMVYANGGNVIIGNYHHHHYHFIIIHSLIHTLFKY